MCTLKVINHYHIVKTLNDKLLGLERNLSNEMLSPSKDQTAQKHTLEKQTLPHVIFLKIKKQGFFFKNMSGFAVAP